MNILRIGALAALASFFAVSTALAADTAPTPKAPPSAYVTSIQKTWTFDIGLGLAALNGGINENPAPKGTALGGDVTLNVTRWFGNFGLRAGAGLGLNKDLTDTYVTNLGGGWVDTTKVTFHHGPQLDLKALGVYKLGSNLEVGLGPMVRIEHLKASIHDVTTLGGAVMNDWKGSSGATKARPGLEGTVRLTNLANFGGMGLGLEGFGNWVAATKVKDNGISYRVKDDFKFGARVIATF